MSTAAPHLSIIVPTKARYETLMSVLQALAYDIASDEVEFVVQDSSARADAGALHALRHDPRIKYHHDPEPISIVDNTIRAIEHSKGTCALFFGNDDFVTLHVMSFVDLLDRSGLSRLIFEPARCWRNMVTFAHPTLYNKPSAFWLPRAIGGGCARAQVGRLPRGLAASRWSDVHRHAAVLSRHRAPRCDGGHPKRHRHLPAWIVARHGVFGAVGPGQRRMRACRLSFVCLWRIVQ